MKKDFNEFKNYIRGKKAAVVGIGVSNIPLINFLLKLGADVTGFDRKTKEELESFNPDTYSKSNSPNPGDNGLMFCDSSANYNSARCLNAEVCPGSYDGNCNPRYLWSGTLNGSTNVNRYLQSGS